MPCFCVFQYSVCNAFSRVRKEDLTKSDPKVEKSAITRSTYHKKNGPSLAAYYTLLKALELLPLKFRAAGLLSS